jgi:hypothetical protein
VSSADPRKGAIDLVVRPSRIVGQRLKRQTGRRTHNYREMNLEPGGAKLHSFVGCTTRVDQRKRVKAGELMARDFDNLAYLVAIKILPARNGLRRSSTTVEAVEQAYG